LSFDWSAQQGMDLLPTFRGATRRYSSAASWVLSSDIRLEAGCASAHRLMLMGMYNIAISKSRLAFMVTTEQEALEGLAIRRPGLLIITQQLEQGSGQSVVEQARSLVSDVRTILIMDGPNDDLVAAGRSSADAVLLEADCFGHQKPIVSLTRALSIGQRYRSASVVAAMEADSVQRDPWRDQPPDLNARELEIVDMLVQGLSDREIAEQLVVSYETARSRSKVLRRKLGANNRAQVVAKAVQLGLARLGAG
jgi:DNA-binding NarL/FixJ family response regulator